MALQEIVSVEVPGRKGQQPTRVDQDEAPGKFREEKLRQLRPVLMGNVVSAGVGQVTNSLLWIACCQHILKTLVMFYGRK